MVSSVLFSLTFFLVFCLRGITSFISPVKPAITLKPDSFQQLIQQKSRSIGNPSTFHQKEWKVWEQNQNSNNEAQEGEDTIKKYGLEVGLLKTYLDKSSKVRPKDLISRYGIAYFGTSITLAIISYALCYVLIANGVDVASLLQKIGIKPSEAAVSAGTGGLAYAVHKAASPIRFIPTIVLTPLVAKWIGKKPKNDEVSSKTAVESEITSSGQSQ